MLLDCYRRAFPNQIAHDDYDFIDITFGPGAQISLRNREHCIEIHEFGILPDDRGTGLGSEMLSAVCRVADENKIYLAAFPYVCDMVEDDPGGLTLEQLTDWFVRHGFIPCSKKGKYPLWRPHPGPYPDEGEQQTDTPVDRQPRLFSEASDG